MWTKRRQFSFLIILVKDQEMQGVFVVVVVLFFLKVCQKDGLWTNQNIKLHASSGIRKIYDLNIWLSCTYICFLRKSSVLFVYLFILFVCFFVSLFLFSVAVCLLCWIVCLSVYFFVCPFISLFVCLFPIICLFVCFLTISCRLTYNSLLSGLPKWG